MKNRKFYTFNSDFFSATIDEKSSLLAFFGVESGGRDRDKHASYNLVLPGRGGISGIFKKKAPDVMEKGEDFISFAGEGGRGVKYSFDGQKELCVDITKPFKSNIFDINWSIKTAPPTIWTRSITGKGMPRRIKCDNPLVLYKTRYDLPLIVHFPDFGRVEISSDNKDIYCAEELTLSSDLYGLDLGYLNHSHNHNRMHGLHYGFSNLKFMSSKPLDSARLTFKVLDECYPPLPDESDPRFNGLKRNWINSFAVNRELFDMGDNIYFNGTGHLAIHMKSDMLQIVDKNDNLFKMVRKVYEKQIARSFDEAQSVDGDVSISFFKREKTKNACSVDSTPGAIIGLCGIASWNKAFAKKHIEQAIKAGNFLLTCDTDGDGIFEADYPGDYMGQPWERGYQTNWWDNFAFGHKDIYFNYLAHRALRELSALLRKLKIHEDVAEKYEKQLEKFDKSFFDTFYNPESELMVGWISANGKIHDYAFTFAVSMGINEGLIPKNKGRKMLQKLLDMMDKEGYGDLRFGIPGNAQPVAQVDTIYWPCMSDWGRYENGGLSGMNGFHFLTAMYNVGMSEQADKILFAIMDTYEKDLTHSGLMPGYCCSIDWRTKEGVPCGYNYLADNYYFLLSAYVGKYKMKHPAVNKRR